MPYQIYLRPAYSNELYHHGIKGQKWGVRRFQNKDGSLTSAGKKRYAVSGNIKSKKAIPYETTKYYVNGAPAGIETKWYTKDDYKDLNKQDRKTLRRSEKGRNRVANREYYDAYKKEFYKYTLKQRMFGGAMDEIEKEAINKAIEKASKLTIEEALYYANPFHKP